MKYGGGEKLVTSTLRMEAVVPPKLQQVTLEMIEPIYHTVRGYVTEDSGFVVTARIPSNRSRHVRRRLDKKSSHEAGNLWRPLLVAPHSCQYIKQLGSPMGWG
jgi:hypothetical protein